LCVIRGATIPNLGLEAMMKIEKKCKSNPKGEHPIHSCRDAGLHLSGMMDSTNVHHKQLHPSPPASNIPSSSSGTITLAHEHNFVAKFILPMLRLVSYALCSFMTWFTSSYTATFQMVMCHLVTHNGHLPSNAP
jgi:hypothetical protein